MGNARPSATGDGAVEAVDGGSLVHLKVVPGASRSRVVGPHGDRIKLTVAAAPERGRANREVRRLLATVLGVRATDVELVRGASDARKTVCVRGLDPAAVRDRLGS